MEKTRSRSPARVPDNQRGFSLLETVVAAGLVAGAFAALAQMFGLSVAHNSSARISSTAMILAGQKMEELRALAWGVDLSPGGALIADVAGYVDYTDSSGEVLGTGGPMPPGTAYVRRWSVAILSSSPDALVLQVLVARPAQVAPAGREAAHLVTLRIRKTP